MLFEWLPLVFGLSGKAVSGEFYTHSYGYRRLIEASVKPMCTSEDALLIRRRANNLTNELRSKQEK
jgi:hypothetical protein